LKFGKRQRAALAPRQQFSIADEVARELGCGANEIGKLFGDAIEIA
jgi:hypothetical protein